MITFGLTGGIAVGKSRVTRTFRANNIPIVDADIVAREVVVPGSIGHNKIMKRFGPPYFNQDNTLNRTKLAALVFSNKLALRELNAIMLPLISSESNKQIDILHKEHPIVGYDAALIIEQGNADKFRPLIVVGCSLEIQLARVIARTGLTEAEAMDRISAQMTFEEKSSVADYIINTSGSLEDSYNQTIQIISILQKE
jgi:dephospho-CoA kinase